MSRSVIERVIKKLGGTHLDVAKFCGLSTPQSIAYWKKTGVVPAVHVRKIARATGIPPSKLNPLFKE